MRSLLALLRWRVHPGLLLGPTLSLRWRRRLALSRAQVGAAGEALVARSLQRAGARVCGRRVRTRWAEVDLVACLGDSLLLVEVKTASPRHSPARPSGAPRLPTRSWAGPLAQTVQPADLGGTARVAVSSVVSSVVSSAVISSVGPVGSAAVGSAAGPTVSARDASAGAPAGLRPAGLVPPWSLRPARGLGPEQRRRLEQAGRAARRSWGGPVQVLLAEVMLDQGHGREPVLHWTELLHLPGA
ncbi:MAG: YraN family protein [Planctomycetes bacterium]|nr:YraN family protein [Planctomycetota bacterium]